MNRIKLSFVANGLEIRWLHSSNLWLLDSGVAAVTSSSGRQKSWLGFIAFVLAIHLLWFATGVGEISLVEKAQLGVILGCFRAFVRNGAAVVITAQGPQENDLEMLFYCRWRFQPNAGERSNDQLKKEYEKREIEELPANYTRAHLSAPESLLFGKCCASHIITCWKRKPKKQAVDTTVHEEKIVDEWEVDGDGEAGKKDDDERILKLFVPIDCLPEDPAVMSSSILKSKPWIMLA